MILSSSGQGEIEFTVDDEKTRAMLIANAGTNKSLKYNESTQVFTLSQSAFGADAKITFASPQNIGALHVTGLAAGSSGEVLSLSNTLPHTVSGANDEILTDENY